MLLWKTILLVISEKGNHIPIKLLCVPINPEIYPRLCDFYSKMGMLLLPNQNHGV